MNPDDLRERITDQFSYNSDRADVWRALNLVLDTQSFLNLGYSHWYQPHPVGSSQRRLTTKIGERLESHLQSTADRPLLDVGCGRGGPAVHLSNHWGFDVTGVDLVPHNIRQATHNARKHDATAWFVVGDATALPFAPETMAACTAIDSLVYVPDRGSAVTEISRVLAPDGVVVISDLVQQSGLSTEDRETVAEFTDAWDMPSPGTTDEYRRMITGAGLDIHAVEEITNHSIGRFRKWSTVFLGLLDSPVRPIVIRLLQWRGLDPRTIQAQVRAAHRALPSLEHVVVVARK